MTNSILITGCNGDIGQSLSAVFAESGWHVVGVDRVEATAETDYDFIQEDIESFILNPKSLSNFGEKVRALCKESPLKVVINNAAIQHLGALGELSDRQIVQSMNVNLISPMLMAKEFLPELKATRGSVINIGSVHAQATKPGFAAYATSKTGLHGLTRALAVDLGPEVRVNTLAPAATATKMLKAGFEGNEAAFQALKEVHPLQRIAEPIEIAKIAKFLASSDAAFLSGATVFADGGVLSRLHDPA